MKSTLSPIAAAVAAILILPNALSAAEGAPPPAAIEKRVCIIKAGGEAKDLPMEKVTFIGVEALPASESLVAQLGLKRGIGLVVGHVVPDSPAAAILQRHDVLTKLNDQWLIEPHQLAVLVQSFDAGSEVTVTFLRAGKEQTAKAKLSQRERPRAVFFNPRAPGASWTSRDTDGLLEQLRQGGVEPGRRMEIQRRLRVLPRELDRGETGDVIIHAPGGTGVPHLSIMATPRAVLVYRDDDGVVELRRKDGKRFLEVRDKANKVTFSGEVTTPEQRAKLAPEIVGRLAKVESVNGLDIDVTTELETEEHSFLPAGEPAARIGPAASGFAQAAGI